MENFIVVRILDLSTNGSKKILINLDFIAVVSVLLSTTLSVEMNNGSKYTVFIDDNPILKKFHSDLIKEM